ncbi:MAG: hypothetical protein ACXVCY_08260 [Pseudobdellovibrionaceae bacterium]
MNFRSELGVLFSCITFTFTTINASASYNYSSEGVVSKSCLLNVFQSGKMVNANADELSYLFLAGLKDKGYYAFAQWNYFGKLQFPVFANEQKSHPELFANDMLTADIASYTYYDEPSNCNKNQIPFRVGVVINAHEMRSYESIGIYKDIYSQPHEYYENVCLNRPYNSQEQNAAELMAIKSLAAKLPSCDQWWNENTPLIGRKIINLNNGETGRKLLGLCSTTDNLDKLNFMFFIPNLVEPNSGIGLLATANGEVQATTASQHELFIKKDNAGISQMHVSMKYNDKNGIERNIGNLFSVIMTPSFDTTFGEYTPPVYYTPSRNRTIHCDFNMDLFKN